MYQSKNVLVVVDFRQLKHHALPRALDLARQFGSKLTVVTSVYQSVVDIVPSDSGIDIERIRSEAIVHYKDEMQELTQELIGEGVNVEQDIHFEVIWNKSFHQGLLEYINKHSFDLIVKTAHHHSRFEKTFFTPTDWHLLRDTDTNILFVKKGAWPSSTNILGAINIEDDKAHQNLNHAIVETTASLAKACDSQPHLINVFPWATLNIEKFRYLFDKKDQFIEIKNAHQQAVARFVKNFGEFKDNIIVAEGIEPEVTIPEIIKSTFSDLLVIGCVRRKGLSGMVIGNTVEKILDEINCEVLVLK